MTRVMTEAEKHEGFSLIEVLQNCVIFNDNVYAGITDKAVRADNQLILEHGKPMLFGKDMNKGLRLNGLNLEVVTVGENGITLTDILVHDAHTENPALHYMLASMKLPDFPVAMGIIRKVKAATFDDALHQQITQQRVTAKHHSLNDLFLSGNTFKIA
jgi:2-oxoglutarate ferredoxin oxidoreductase subunit beta